MNSVLMVGGSGTFLSELVDKFAKEGWRIFTLVGERAPSKPDRVFEQYPFDPGSDSIWEVIQSCRPNLILYLGAHDPAFHWNAMGEKEDARRYIAGLSNLLLAARDARVPRFLYLSGDCVFGEHAGGARLEGDAAAPSTVRGASIRQGEALALAEGSEMQAHVLRLPEIAFVPQSVAECRGGIAALSLEALRAGNMRASGCRMLSCFYVGDAVQAVFLLSHAKQPAQKLYHVGAASMQSEYDVARMIARAAGHDLPIEEIAGEASAPVRLVGEAFAEEFGFAARTSCTEAAQAIYRAMAGQRNRFGAQERAAQIEGFWQRAHQGLKNALPFLECLVLIAPVYLLGKFSLGVAFLGEINFYLLFVLLFALMRGRQVAIFAFSLSVIAYVVGAAGRGGLAPALIDVKTYAWVLELFVVGVFTGSLRDRLALIESEKNEEIDFLASRLQDITAINQSNTRLKNYFQELTINSNESIGWFYDVISELDRAESGEVIFIAAKVLSRILGIRDVSLYANARHGYLRLLASTTPEARVMGKSIRREDYKAVFDAMEGDKIYINKALDRSLPSMAGSLLDADGESAFVFFLWNMPYEKMTLYYANMLRVAETLIYNALMRSARYLDALAYRRYIPETNALLPEAFAEMCAIYRKMRGEGMTEFVVLELPMGGRAVGAWCERLQPLLRGSDFVGLLAEDLLGILLINTSRGEARFVIDRLNSSGIEARFRDED